MKKGLSSTLGDTELETYGMACGHREVSQTDELCILSKVLGAMEKFGRRLGYGNHRGKVCASSKIFVYMTHYPDTDDEAASAGACGFARPHRRTK
jgi:hypothetical protein